MESEWNTKYTDTGRLPKSGNKEIMAQMKEQNGTPEKELSDAEIANVSDAEFKTLVVRMLKDLAEYGRSNIGKK